MNAEEWSHCTCDGSVSGADFQGLNGSGANEGQIHAVEEACNLNSGVRPLWLYHLVAV